MSCVILELKSKSHVQVYDQSVISGTFALSPSSTFCVGISAPSTEKETRKMFNMVIEAMDQMEQRMNKRFDQMATKEELRNVYESLHHEINGVKLNTEALDLRMDYVEKKLDSVDNRLTIVETKVDSLETKVDSLGKKVDSLEVRVDSLESKMDDMHITLQSMRDHGTRIQALEHEVFGKNKRARRTLWQPLH